MVASISVLGSAKAGGGQPFDGGYFMRLANADYYSGGGEPPGKWYGAGAAALGLTGIVEALEFAHVLAGRRPDGQEFTNKQPAAKNRRKSKHRLPLRPARPAVPGFDVCYSPPKSVSVLWAAAAGEQRKAIELSLDLAVKATLDWLASNVSLVRRGKGGRTQQLAELVIAQFDHGTSRKSASGRWEPNLHRHCVIANMARGEDGRWTAVNSRLLHEWTRTLGPMFRATLARELQTRLGVELMRPNDSRGHQAGWFEIAGVPDALCKHWSSRRGEIEELLSASQGMGNFSAAKARENANLLTRRAKGDIPPREKLFSEWQTVARELGLNGGAIENLKGRSQPVEPEQAFQQAWESAQQQLDASQSSFTFREAIQRVCEAAQTFGVAGDWLANRTRQALEQSPEIRPLGVVKGEARYATERMWQTEQKLLSEFDKLRSTSGASIKDSVRVKVTQDHPHLFDDQRDAVDHILSATSSLRILTGVAGAGKSTTLDVVRDAFEKSGYRVIGGALAGVAKEELAVKASIPARTVASYLHHLDKPGLERLVDRVRHEATQLLRAAQGKSTHAQFNIKIDNKTVLILDEAGMIDSATLLKLATIVRERGATLILVGDTAQLQSVAAGGGFEHLLRNERAPHLSTNLRQHEEADRKASENLRQGDAAAALKNYAERGRLTITANRTEAITSLVTSWTEAGGAVSPKEHVIFTPTRAEAEAANRLAQRAREAAGLIDRRQSLPNGEGVICQGDRVLFHKNVFADGIRNGYRGEVINVNRFAGKLTIRLDGSNSREVTIRLRDYGPEGLTLSYAQTTHKGQGQTVGHAYILAGGQLADREMAYVQATRGRYSTNLFVDEAHAGEELKDLTRTLSRSRRKELAHDIAARAEPLIHKHPSPELGL